MYGNIDEIDQITQFQNEEIEQENQNIDALMEEIEQYENSIAKMEEEEKRLAEEKEEILLDIHNQNSQNEQKKTKVETCKNFREQTFQFENQVKSQHDILMKEEALLIDDIIKSESSVFLLKENIHSFALLKDYFTENDNPWYDNSLKITKYNGLQIERRGNFEEEKIQKNNGFKIDKILHEQSFKYFCSPIEFIQKRLSFIFDYFWKEKDLWSDPQQKTSKVGLILGNKSLQIFEGLLETILNQVCDGDLDENFEG